MYSIDAGIECRTALGASLYLLIGHSGIAGIASLFPMLRYGCLAGSYLPSVVRLFLLEVSSTPTIMVGVSDFILD